MQNVHVSNNSGYSKPALKNNCQKDGKVSRKTCNHEIMTELNTHMNGSKTNREKRLIHTLMNLAQIKQEPTYVDCEVCDLTFNSRERTEKNETDVIPCDLCE